jgi:DNA-directed RNA polymerase sigma subunit (sigma70/sigma32)
MEDLPKVTFSLDAPAAEDGTARFTDYLTDESGAVWEDRLLDSLALEEALAGLSELQRTVLWARACGYSLAEIGAVVGLTRQGVNSSEGHAIQKARAAAGGV